MPKVLWAYSLFSGWKKCVCYLLLWGKGKEQDIKNLWCIWSKSVSIHWWHRQTVWDDNGGMPQNHFLGLVVYAWSEWTST